MAQTVYSRVDLKNYKLGRREQLLMLEIGKDTIDSASAFVKYISDEYGLSSSSVWYNLNNLKEMRLLDFANKEEIRRKPLSLTLSGIETLAELEKSKGVIFAYFMPMELSAMQRELGNRQSAVDYAFYYGKQKQGALGV